MGSRSRRQAKRTHRAGKRRPLIQKRATRRLVEWAHVITFLVFVGLGLAYPIGAEFGYCGPRYLADDSVSQEYEACWGEGVIYGLAGLFILFQGIVVRFIMMGGRLWE